MSVRIPRYHEMMNPLLQALRDLGGSGTIEEIENQVGINMHLSNEQIEELHDPDRGGLTAIGYRLAWTRTYLKKFGHLENSARGVWALTEEGRKTEKVDPKVVVKTVRAMDKESQVESHDGEIAENIELNWQNQLLDILQKMDPTAFERLTKRILRESGFTQVDVTGQSGDGGIDGKGILRINGMLSFHVFFQCKRYKGSVGAGQIRDFRGAMTGRADKGIFITTGTFTMAAKDEAKRDGAPPLDLIDGDDLVNLLKELSLGVKTVIIQSEEITISADWFSTI
jgi:restriction system protein